LSGGPSLQVTRDPSVDLSENRRLVTVLFADLSGSTTLGEHLDPEDLRGILTSFFAALAREIQRYGGTVDKYIGDAVMAVFGAPVAHEDDAERAISAAIAMQAAITQLNADLERRHGRRLALRIGINTGEVVAGLLAGDVQGAYTVVGDTVNTAQRFESAAAPGTILVAESTRNLTRRAFDFETLQPLVMKGKAEPQPAFRVLGARYESVDPSAVPLVGRSNELAQLERALDLARRGHGGMVHVVGDAGIGKSRLVRELRLGMPPEVLQVVGRCVSFEVDRPYALLARLVRDVVRLPPENDENAAREAIERVLVVVNPTVDADDTALLLSVLGYSELSTFDPQSGRRVLLRLLRRLLQAYTEQAPLLIVAEDMHWADAASTAVLSDLARDIPARRCLLLSTARPGSPPPWPAEVVSVDALPQDGARALIESAFAASVDDALAETILARTGGNPFFIEEVARGLREAGVVEHQDGRVTARAGAAPRVPTTVQEVLEARLDRLSPAAKRVLQVAAVCGRVFRQRVLERLVPDFVHRDSLGVLERESFILSHTVQPEPTFTFRHALIQEVAYNGQLQAQRRVTHAAIGEALEALYADRLDELVGELAFHYGQSLNDDKALHWLIRAGDRARSLFANTEALLQYRAAVARADESASAPVFERIGEIQTLIGQYDEATESFSTALARTQQQRGGTVARLRRRLGTAFLLRGAYTQASGALSEALESVTAEDREEAARAQIQIGHLNYRRGDFVAARAALVTAIEIASSLGADDVIAEAYKWLGTVEIQTGDLKRAVEFYERSRSTYEYLEDLGGIAELQSNLGMAYRRMGLWDEALAQYHASLALRERMGNTWGVATCHNNIGEVNRSRGELGQALESFQRAMAIFESIGAATEAAITLIGVGAARVERGDVDQGRANLQGALARLSELGSTGYLPDVYRYLASAELMDNNLDAAEEAAQRSLEHARIGSARHQEAATLRVMAEIALARGEPAEARALLEVSRETLRKLGDTLELARTEAVLQRMK